MRVRIKESSFCLRALRTTLASARLSVIFPYRLEGVWVFDDAATGLVREPFISGADTILDVLAEHIPNAADGFKRSSRQDPFQAIPPDSFGLELNTKAIGIDGQSGKWKDGCVRPSSSISKVLPKRFSCRRPLKAREIRRLQAGGRLCWKLVFPRLGEVSGKNVVVAQC